MPSAITRDERSDCEIREDGGSERGGIAEMARYAPGDSYLDYGDSIVQKHELRAPYLDTLDKIFLVKRSEFAKRGE